MTGDNPLGRVNLDIAARLVEGLAAKECTRAKEALGPLFDTDTTSYPVGHLAELAAERIKASTARIQALQRELEWFSDHGAT